MSAPRVGCPRDQDHPPDVDRPGLHAAPAASDDRQVDHDQVAATARRRRLASDIDRVRSLAAAHDDEHPDWTEVAGLLDRLRATLDRDLAPLPAGP